jgi:hypothetical protein
MPRRPAAFDGCVIGESLRDPTLINRLEVWRAWISPHELVSDDQGTMARWHIYWIACDAEDADRIRGSSNRGGGTPISGAATR